MKLNYIKKGLNHFLVSLLMIAAILLMGLTVSNAQTTATFAGLGGSDTGGTGFKTITDVNIVVENRFIAANPDIYFNDASSSSATLTIKADGDDAESFDVSSFILYAFNANGVHLASSSTIVFKDKNDNTLRTMALSENKTMAQNVDKDIFDMFDTGTTSPVTGVATIEFNIDLSNCCNNGDNFSSLTFKSITYDNVVAPGSSAAPTITTTAITSYDASSATMGGYTTTVSSLIPRGVIYSLFSVNPTADPDGGGWFREEISSDQNEFSKRIYDLEVNTKYAVRSYVGSGGNVDYGSVKTFTTPDATELRIDLGDVPWDPSDPSLPYVPASPGGNWNTIANIDRNILVENLIDYNTGEATTVDIQGSNFMLTGSGSFVHHVASKWTDLAAGTDFFYGLSDNGATLLTVTISNLPDDKYTVEVVSNYFSTIAGEADMKVNNQFTENNNYGTSTIDVRLGDDTFYTPISTSSENYNPYHFYNIHYGDEPFWFIWEDVATTAEGEIIITISGTTFGIINAIRLVAAEEIVASTFRTKSDGNWSNISTWEVSEDESTWVDATETPTADNSAGITVRHDVTVDADVSIDQTIIESDAIYTGTLSVNSGITLTIANDDGDDLTANGDLDINGTLSIGTATIDANGSFDGTGGNVVFSDAGFLNLGGAVTSLGTFTKSTSTVTYDGGDQDIDAIDYHILALSGSSSTKTFADGTTKVDQEISLTDDITLTGSATDAVTVQVTDPYNWNGTSGNESATESRVFYINASGKTINIENMTIKGGDLTGGGEGGGGIRFQGTSALNLNYVNIVGSKATNGGAIYVYQGQTLNLSHCSVNGNISTGTYKSGAGIRLYDCNSCSIENSTIFNNASINTFGGGIMASFGDDIEIVNSTIFGNTATGDGADGSGDGAGIYIQNNNCTIKNSTISGNSASQQGGGIYNNGGSLLISNSIIAGDANNDDYYYNAGTLTDNGYNVVETSNVAANATGGFNNATSILYNTKFSNAGTSFSSWSLGGTELTNQNLNLSSLADNGGTTQTLALEAGSFAAAAIPYADEGSGVWNGSPTTDGNYFDQRGVEFQSGVPICIGAFSETFSPSTQATNVAFLSTTGTQQEITWTRGDGDGCAVFMLEGTSGLAAPVISTVYSANAEFESGDQIGTSGWYCVYNGTGTTETVTGLTSGVVYRVHVCEFNNSSLYNTESSTNNPNNLCINPNSGGTIASSQSSCDSFDPEPFTSSASPSGHTGDLEYQWQYSTTGPSSGFNDISGTNSTTCNTSTVTTTTWYKRLARVSCKEDWENAAESNVIAATVYETFTPGAIEIAGETICFNGDPGEIGSSTAASGGDGDIMYKWESSLDGFTTAGSEISGATSSGYDPPTGLQATTSYRRYAHDGICNTSFEQSNGTWTVTVRDEFTPGAIETTGEPVCYGGDPGEIGSSTDGSGGDESLTYSWRSSADNYATAISGASSATYTPPSGLTTTTSYRRYAHDGICNTSFEQSTGTWTVTVRDEFTPGAIETTGEPICYGGDPGEIGSSTDGSGGDESLTYSWRSSADNYATAISGASSATYTPPSGLTTTTSYRRYAHDGICNTSFEQSTGTWTVTVRDEFTPGAIETTGEPICYGGDPGEIGSSTDGSGGDESLTYSWRSSADNYATAISGASSATYTPPSGLTTTTSYRRYAHDGICNTSFEQSTGTWTVTVRDEFTPGAIETTGEPICYGGDPGEIGSSTDGSGGDESLTYSWRSSADNYATAIPGASSATYTPPSGLTTTTSYRRYAHDGICNTSFEQSTGTWTVTVRDEFTPGAIETTGEPICYGGDPGEIGSSTDGSGGDESLTYSWRSSADNYATAISGASSATYTPPSGLTTTTSYRRYAHDGTCNTSFEQSTGTWTVTVRDEFTPGAIETTGETICYDGDPSEIGSSTAASGGDETITYKWESSLDEFATEGSEISGATSSSYDPPSGLQATTSYRRYAHDGTCNTTFEVSTGTWTVTVREDFTPGVIETTGETICYDGDPVEIGSATAASGGDASITYKWESSLDEFATAGSLISGASSSSYNPPSGLQATTSYRRYAHDGTCNTTFEASTGTWTVTVRDDFTPGAIETTGETTGETICYDGDPGEIGSSTAASGGDETITYKWESSTDGFATAGSVISGATSSSYNPPTGLTATTSYRRYAHDGTCNTTFEVSTGTWLVTVYDDFTPGTIETTGESIIYNADPSEIGGLQVASGGDGNIMYQWQSSTDESFSSPSSINSNTASYDPPPNLTVTTWYRRQAKDGTCSSAFTSSTGVWKVEVFAPRVVNSNQGTQFYYIQDAIDAANPGDHIIVMEPTGEHLMINKELTIEYDYSGHED